MRRLVPLLSLALIALPLVAQRPPPRRTTRPTSRADAPEQNLDSTSS
jgi:hypothetical protein